LALLLFFLVFGTFFPALWGFLSDALGLSFRRFGPNEAFLCEFGTISPEKPRQNQCFCQNPYVLNNFAQEFAFFIALLSILHSKSAQTLVFQPFSGGDL